MLLLKWELLQGTAFGLVRFLEGKDLGWMHI